MLNLTNRSKNNCILHYHADHTVVRHSHSHAATVMFQIVAP